MNASRSLRAVVYVRLSSYRGDTDPTTSPERQRAACAAYIEAKGWTLAEIVEDLDVSGSDKGLRLNRPGLARVRALFPEVDVVVFAKLDRLARNVVDFRAFAEEAAAQDVALVSVAESLDLTTPGGRFVATILAAFGEMEAAAIAERTLEGIRGAVDARRHRGGVAPFGYTSAPHPSGKGRALTIQPAEARLVREAADIVLDGGSAYAAMKHLQASGVPPRRAKKKQWSLSSVIVLLTGDAVLGRMRHRGALVREPDGTIAQPWPAVLPLADVERLRALLAPKRLPRVPIIDEDGTPVLNDKGEPVTAAAREGFKRGERSRTARLLSGLLACSTCGARLRVSSSSNGKRYTCHGLADGAGCSAPVSIVAEPLDEHLATTYLDAVGWMPEVRREDRLADVSGLAEVEEAITATAAAMTAPDADVPVLVERLQALRERRVALASAPAEPEVVEVVTGRTVAEAWEASSLDERRALLRSALDGPVVIRPGVRGRRGLDMARIGAPWRGVNAPEPFDPAWLDD